jgi:hypothetical protein
MKKQMNFLGSQQGRLEVNFKRLKSELGDYMSDADIMKLAQKQMPVNPNAYASSFQSDKLKGITWNAEFNNARALKSIKQSVASKFSPKGCDSIKAIIDHEFGHRVDILSSLSNNPTFNSIYQKHVSKGMGYVKENLSKYAYVGKDPKAEFIAEAWSEYLNNPNPRGIAKEVGDLILSLLK